MNSPLGSVKSLYRQLLIALIVLVTIVSFIVSLLNVLYSSHESEATFESKVLVYSDSLRDSLEWPLWNVDDELVSKIGTAFSSNTDIASLIILDDQKHVIYDHFKPNENQTKRLIVIEHEGAPIGSAEIGLSLSAYETKYRELLLNGLLSTLLLIVSLLAALRWLLARLLKKPIDTLIGVIDEVVEDKYQSMPIADTYSEFSPILTRFKMMMEVIASRESCLIQSNENLLTETTERLQAEQEKRFSDERLRAFYELDLVGLAITSPETGWLSVNSCLCTMLEYSEQELLGMTWAELTHPDDLAADVKQFNRMLAYEIEGYSLEKRFICRTGKIIHSQLVVRCVRKENCQIDYVIAMVQDITARKRMEVELRINEERLKLATRAGGVGIWDWDITSNTLVWDESMYALYGICSDNFDGAFDTWTRTLHPDDREFVESEIQAALGGERDLATEFRVLRPDGTVRNIKVSSKTNFDSKGTPIRMIGTNFDITDVKQTLAELQKYKDHLEEEIQQRTADLVLARDAAEEASISKSIFLSSMSHELRTPLNAILGFSGLMQRDEHLNSEQRKNLDIINRSGTHLLTLINDVLEMAKIEAGRTQLEITAFDLGAMVRDVTDMMENRSRDKGLQLLLDQSSAFPRFIKGDEARLRQILINLIGNAVKFTDHGVITRRLASRQNSNSHLIIEVEDSGRGISTEDQKRLFQPFVQLGKQGGDNKGTGLGLSITRQFVQLMGGSISIESVLNKGSLFRIDLPLNEVKDEDVILPKKSDKAEVVGLAPGQPEYRILIIEDQPENQMLLLQLMQRVGLSVKLADNGKQGVKLFKSWQPHLIWMDRCMPVMDGLEATKIIRSLPGGKEVKIVAVTASAFMEQRAEILKVGMDDFVRKPYRFNEIYECLTKQLNVKFIYTDVVIAEDLEPAQLKTQMFAVLPPALCKELADALDSLDSDFINGIILKVAVYDLTLHKALIHLADRFDYSAILKALPPNQEVN